MATLTNDAVLAVCDVLGVQTLPLVLGVGPRQDSIESFTLARNSAMTELRDAGLVDDYDDVDAELGAAVHILAQPQRELAVRSVTASGIGRICLARRGSGHALAIRVEDVLDVATTWADDSGEALARPLLAALGAGPPAPIPTFSAPADELAGRLGAARTSAEFTAIPFALGVEERDAVEFGLAMADCHAYAEIVAYAHEDGHTHRSSGAVAVYDTARGRIAASPGAAPDLSVWTTFTPGSDHRIAQAISALVETLPGGGWAP